VQAEEILIGCFVERQSTKKVGGRRFVEELYQALFFVSPWFRLSRLNVSPSETKIEPDRRLTHRRRYAFVASTCNQNTVAIRIAAKNRFYGNQNGF